MSGRLAVLVALAVAGCQAGCNDREVVGAVPVKSVLVMAASGGLITVTAQEDPVLAGVYLRIPAGSLPGDLVVTIERGGQDIAGTTTLPASPVVIVGPLGTPLSIPARLGLPVGQGTTGDLLFIELEDTDGRRSRLTASATGPNAAIAEADIDGFAAFQASRLRPGAGGPDGGAPPPPPPPPPRGP